MKTISWRLYIVYVIGETLLLVLGILAALAIDNWWEEQKELELEEYLIEQLLEEFRNDSLQLTAEVEVLKNKALQGEILRESVQEQSPLPVSELVATAFAVGKMALFESYTPTFEEIVSSGRLHILRNVKLKEGIKAL